MGLGRILTLLAVPIVVILILSGLGVYAVLSKDVAASRIKTFDFIGQETADRIGLEIARIQRTLEALAGDPEIAALLNEGNRRRLVDEADRLTGLVPGSLRVRLLPGTQFELDETRRPPLSFADLDMVREAVDSETVTPMVHAFGSEDSHLAAAKRVVYAERVLGVILASMSADFIARFLTEAGLEGGGLELKQGQLSLAFSGRREVIADPPDRIVPVPGGRWKLNLWYPPIGTGGNPILSAGIILLSGALLAVACFFAAFRLLSRDVESDFNSIFAMTKDMLSGKAGRNYPVKLMESEELVSKLLKLKASESIEQLHPGGVESPNYDEIRAELEGGLPEDSVFHQPEKARDQKEESPSKRFPEEIFRAYDIRGVVGEGLSREIVFNLGRAIGSEALDGGDDSVIIGYDGRTSSPELSQVLGKGIRETGANVIDIGMVPTPVLYFAIHQFGTRSGVMVTGSHNPPEYNGLKMVIAGETLSGDKIQRLRQRIESGLFHQGQGAFTTKRVATDYIAAVTGDIQVGRSLKVVLDCGNGVAGEMGPVLLKSLGCEVVKLFCEVDGRFPNHHPDPSKPKNLADLVRAVKEHNADLGIALDGDGDRLGVVDSKGVIIWPDRVMMVFAGDVLSRHPGADIIYDVKCTRHLAAQIRKLGGRPLMWKTGHSLIKAKIKETGAKLAGEMSGHIFFNDRWFGFDDALYSAARLIEIIATGKSSSNELFSRLPDSFNTPELTLHMEEGENFRFVDELMAQANFKDAKTTAIDGLRVDFSDGWGLVRPSNTTPSLVIRFEADTPAALERIQSQFRKLMKKVDPNLILPF